VLCRYYTCTHLSRSAPCDRASYNMQEWPYERRRGPPTYRHEGNPTEVIWLQGKPFWHELRINSYLRRGGPDFLEPIIKSSSPQQIDSEVGCRHDRKFATMSSSKPIGVLKNRLSGEDVVDSGRYGGG
jgi:hypothetical protein